MSGVSLGGWVGGKGIVWGGVRHGVGVNVGDLWIGVG